MNKCGNMLKVKNFPYQKFAWFIKDKFMFRHYLLIHSFLNSFFHTEGILV